MKWSFVVVDNGSTTQLGALPEIPGDSFWSGADFRVLSSEALSVQICASGKGLSISEWAGGSHSLRLKGLVGQADQLLALIQLEGDGELVWEGHPNRQANIRASEFALFPMAQSVTFKSEGRSRCVMLSFPRSWLEASCPGLQQHLHGAHPMGKSGADLFLSLAQVVQEHGKGVSGKYCELVFKALMGMLSTTLSGTQIHDMTVPASAAAKQNKQHIVSYVLNNLSDPELSITSVADATGLSSRYVCKLFAGDEFHLMQWVWKERLKLSRQALQSATERLKSITSIAYDSGFSDSAHFSRAFARCYGVSPRDFRKNAQQVQA